MHIVSAGGCRIWYKHIDHGSVPWNKFKKKSTVLVIIPLFLIVKQLLFITCSFLEYCEIKQLNSCARYLWSWQLQYGISVPQCGISMEFIFSQQNSNSSPSPPEKIFWCPYTAAQFCTSQLHFLLATSFELSYEKGHFYGRKNRNFYFLLSEVLPQALKLGSVLGPPHAWGPLSQGHPHRNCVHVRYLILLSFLQHGWPLQHHRPEQPGHDTAREIKEVWTFGLFFFY